MSKKVCLSPALVALRGNFSSYDEDGHKGGLRFREFTASGKRSFGVGQPKRNLVKSPYSQAEIDQHNAMAQAAKDRVSINGSTTLYAAWTQAWKNAKADGTTNCVTLQGFIQRCLVLGLVNADLTPNLG